jgi:16S rRNA (guanine527-N7)-methyltransferase
VRPHDDLLIDTLRSAQRVGALGDRPVDEVVEHARAFGRALVDVRGTVVDLGSGAGVPGLVLAVDRPDLRIVLVDRREKRTDLLRRAVRRLDLGGRVSVRTIDAERLAATEPGAFDAAVARGFGPPELTLRLAARLVRAGGAVVISEPPAGDERDEGDEVEEGDEVDEVDEVDRWDPALLTELGVTRRRIGSVSRFDRS